MTMHDAGVPDLPYLSVESSGETSYFQLEVNSNVLIGTGDHCKVQLSGEGIESLHCILALNGDGSLQVQDWNTGATLVNGEPISETTIINQGDHLKVGEYSIHAVLSDSQQDAKIASGCDAMDLDKADCHTEDILNETDCESPKPMETAALYDLEDELEVNRNSTGSSCTDVDEYVYDIDADFDDDVVACAPGFEEPAFTNADSIDSDEVEVLRLEVAQLKYELAQRDAEPAQPEMLDRDQTERLVARLEDVLQELRRSDDRIQEMESLLRDSDQAARDEQEERQQMERWVSELESRVEKRENESDAEVEQLKKQLREAKQQSRKSDEKLRTILEEKTEDCESVPSEVLDELNEQVNALREQLKHSQTESEELREQLDNLSTDADSHESIRETEQKLAEMQLEAARERAEISRQRADLTRLKADLEERLEQPREKDNADTRIRAMREHLMELHDQEQQEKAKLKENGLAGRITSLLNRVGR